MREDIVAGLKNAFERGESIEKAVQAFISAGYNKDEVEEAAKSLGFSYSQQGQSTQVPPLQQKSQFQPLPKSPSLTQEIPNVPSSKQAQTTVPNASPAPNNSEKPKSSRKLKIFNIILGIVVFILLIAVGISAWKFLSGAWILG